MPRRMHPRAWATFAWVVFSLAMSNAAHAQATPARRPARAHPSDVDTRAAIDQPRVRPSMWSFLGAVFPGVVVPGLGHRLAGDRDTGRKLMKLQGVAFAGMVVSGGALGLTGASRRVSAPLIPLALASGGMYLLSWGADIYGAAGGACVGGQPAQPAPGVETRVGYAYIHDPQFAYAHMSDVEVTLRRGAWLLSARGQFAIDDDNQRVRARARRLLRSGDGSFLALEAALTQHRYGSDGFSASTVELMIAGRQHLGRFSSSLRGAFAEMALGVGLEATTYAVEGADADVNDLPLGRFGYGVYLGGPTGVHGEVQVYYDHRRDDLVGGLILAGGGNGFVGSVGVDGFLYLSSRLGVSARVQVGSAYSTGLALLWRTTP